MITDELKKITGLTKLSDLTELAKKSGKKKVAVAVAHDEHCLEAVCAVMKQGIISAILIGNERKIREIAAQQKLNLENATIFNEENDVLAVRRAVKFVRAGSFWQSLQLPWLLASAHSPSLLHTTWRPLVSDTLACS